MAEGRTKEQATGQGLPPRQEMEQRLGRGEAPGGQEGAREGTVRQSDTHTGSGASRRQAIRFIVLLGFVSLFSDMVYEGARSSTGPFLLSLGASASVVGLVSGAGELLGYALRLVSGEVADRSGRYWLLTGLGYAINLLSVPFLALTGRWQWAALLVLLERTGKGIRTPSRDVLLSYATQTVGRGYGFGLHEALDQVGAIVGPLVVASAAFAGEGYRTGFAWLAIPAVVALAVLAGARIFYPAPQALESEQTDSGQQTSTLSQPQRRRAASAMADTPASGTAAASDSVPVARSGSTTPGASDSANAGAGEPGQASAEPVRFGRALWLYIAFSSLAVLGFANFQLLSYHFKASHLMADAWIPVAFAVAMAVDAAAALVVGKLYDRVGVRVLFALPLGTLLAVLLVFSFRPILAWAGVLVWGIVMGVQETIMRAAIADLSPLAIRGRAYGVFNTAFGVAWFAGSAIMGALYDISVVGVVAFAAAAQLLALPIFVVLRRQVGHPTSDRAAA